MYPAFLGEDASLSTIISHIEHFLSLGGEDNIGIGADFDGISSLPKDFTGCESLYKIFDELLRLNYSEELVRKIAYKNFHNVFCKVIK